MKVIVLYRVVQEWRFPVFERLGRLPGIDLMVIHGPDFEGSKVINTTKIGSFSMKKEVSLKISGRSSNGKYYIPFSPFLFFRLIKENPDVIISEGTSNLFNSMQGFIYSLVFRKKYIWWSLGNIENRVHTGVRKKLDTLINFIEKKSHAIISYSSFGKKYFLNRGVKYDKIFVAVNVVDTDERLLQIQNLLSTPNSLIPKNKLFRILFVGALIKEKSIEILIDTLSILEKKQPKTFELYLVGDGSHRKELERYADMSKLSNVYFAGKVTDEISKYFLSSDLFVMPGLGGLAVSDALVHGLPVIASIGDGCEKDLIVEGENGYIIKDITSDNLAKKVLDIYNKGEIDELKKNARNVINKYNINNYVEQISKSISYALDTQNY